MTQNASIALGFPDGGTDTRSGIATGGMTLDRLDAGVPASVVDVVAPEGVEWARWLHEIGFVPGEPLMLMTRGFGGDPLVVRIGASTFALRRAEAACVHVQPSS